MTVDYAKDLFDDYGRPIVVVTRTGRTASYVIAASDAPSRVKAGADAICDGTADDVQIQAAIVILAAAGGGILYLSEGTFNIAASLSLTSKLLLKGLNKSTHIVVDAVKPFTPATADDVTIEDIYFENEATNFVDAEFADTTYRVSNLVIKNCEFKNIRIRGDYITNVSLIDNIIHDLFHSSTPVYACGVQIGVSTNVRASGNIIYNTEANALLFTSCAKVNVHHNFCTDVCTNSSTFAIDTGYSTDPNVSHNIINGTRGGILSEGSAGTVNIAHNTIKGTADENGSGIQVWKYTAGQSMADMVSIIGNTISVVSIGIKAYDAVDATISGNKIAHIGQSGIVVGKTVAGSGWPGTDARRFLICNNDIYDFNLNNAAGGGIVAFLTQAIDAYDNNIDGNSVANAVGYKMSATTAPLSRISGGRITGIATNKLSGVPADVRVDRIEGYIARGEIRTYSGTIATLTENAFNSVANPWAQAVGIVSEDIYIATKADTGTPDIDVGIAADATTDSATLFSDVPCETVGLYKSTVATPGAQSVMQIWAASGASSFLNHSIKGAAATGMVATYTVTVMGL
jgi:hypothetical protein